LNALGVETLLSVKKSNDWFIREAAKSVAQCYSLVMRGLKANLKHSTLKPFLEMSSSGGAKPYPSGRTVPRA
jgi:hypothetical protein